MRARQMHLLLRPIVTATFVDDGYFDAKGGWLVVVAALDLFVGGRRSCVHERRQYPVSSILSGRDEGARFRHAWDGREMRDEFE